MRLNVWNVNSGGVSAAAAALVVMSLLLGSVGAMSVVAIDGYGSIAQQGRNSAAPDLYGRRRTLGSPAPRLSRSAAAR